MAVVGRKERFNLTSCFIIYEVDLHVINTIRVMSISHH